MATEERFCQYIEADYVNGSPVRTDQYLSCCLESPKLTMETSNYNAGQAHFMNLYCIL